MVTIGELNYKLSVDATGFNKGMSDAHNQANESGGFMKRALEFATGGAILGGLSAVKDKVLDVAKGMIAGNAEFETYQTQFSVLLGSTDEAKKRLAELAKFGASTPFELPELVRADKVLTSFGIHSQDMLTIVGDVASGTGASFEDMALLMGKFSSGATGEAISRFQELGVATRDELAKMGIQFTKAGQMTTPVAEAMPILEKLMKDKFGGMMDAQSKTFDGMMSNFQDWVGGTLRTLGQPLFELLKDKLQVVLTFLGSPEVQTAVTNFALMLAGMIASGIDAFNNFLVAAKPVFDYLVANLPIAIAAAADAWDTKLYPALSMIWNFIENNIKPLFASLVTVILTVVVPAFIAWATTATTAAVATITALAPVLLPLAAIGAAVFLLYKVWDTNFLGIREALTSFWTTYGLPIFNLLKTWLAVNLPVALQTLSDYWNNVLLPALRATWNFIQTYVMPILSTLVSVHFAILQGALVTLAGFWNNTLLPALTATWAFLNTYVIPIFKLLVEVHIAAMGAALRLLTGFWKDTLLPAITSVYDYLNRVLIPQFEKFSGPTVKAVNDALGAIAKLWKETLQPAWESMKTYLGVTLGPAFNSFGGILSGIKDFFEGIGTAVSDLIGYLQELKRWLDKIGKISVPSKPSGGSESNSPSVSTSALKTSALRTSSLSTSQSPTTVNNYNLGVTTAVSSQGVIDNFVHMQAKSKV